MSRSRRIGRVLIAADYLQDKPEVLSLIQSAVFIHHLEYLYALDSFYLRGNSRWFESVPEGQTPPLYSFIFETDPWLGQTTIVGVRKRRDAAVYPTMAAYR